MVKRRSDTNVFMKTGESPVLNWLKGHKWTVSISVMALIALSLVYDIYGPGGNIEFYSKWAECGQKPVKSIGAGYLSSNVPHYKITSGFALVRYHSTKEFPYYCSPREAELKGFSASKNNFDFPNISSEEYRKVFNGEL